MKKILHLLIALSLVVGLSSFDFAEHKKIGDEAFAILPYRLVEAGIFVNIDSAKAVMDRLYRLESNDQHKYQKILSGLTIKPNQVTYGVLNALSGDHVANPLLLEVDLQTPYSKTNRILALQSGEMEKFNPGAKPTEVLSINPAYGMMAIRDLSHFLNYGRSLNDHLKMIDVNLIEALKDPANIDEVFDKLELTNCLTKYYTLHLFAIHLAEQSGRSLRVGDTVQATDQMYYALLYEAFAEHFLQDGFATGHMFVNRGFTAAAIVNNKALHDFYNGVKTKSVNLKGETWYALGDKKLNSPELYGGYQYMRVENQRLNMYEGIPDSAYNLSERKTQLLSQAVIATYTSMLEVWEASFRASQGDERDILQELRLSGSDIDKYIFDNSKVVYCIAIPYGSERSEMPTDMISDDQIEEFDRIIHPPFSRGFVRSRVANSFMVTLGVVGGDNFSLGGRLNLSMINFNTANLGRSGLRKGKVIHWINPTISGFYSRNGDFITKSSDAREIDKFIKMIEGADLQQFMWNIKGGVNYTVDVFVSEKRFFSVFAYLEGGIDVRDKVFIDKNVYLNPDFSNFEEKYKSMNVTNPTFVPTVGVQLGSLFGLHRFTVPSWIRIPLSIILPLKVSASYHTTRGMTPMWAFTSEIDILF